MNERRQKLWDKTPYREEVDIVDYMNNPNRIKDVEIEEDYRNDRHNVLEIAENILTMDAAAVKFGGPLI